MNIRQGRADFADYFGRKHMLTWTVGLKGKESMDKKNFIKKTDIWTLRIRLDDQLVVWFEAGVWNKRPPLIGVAKDVYRMVLALYS